MSEHHRLYTIALDLLYQERRDTYLEFSRVAEELGYEDASDPVLQDIFDKAVDEHEKFEAALKNNYDDDEQKKLIEAHFEKLKSGDQAL